MTSQPSATPEPYAHEWYITVKADEHAGAIDALFNCIKAWQSGSEPIGGTCPRSMGNRQTYDVVKLGREARTLETELGKSADALVAAKAECAFIKSEWDKDEVETNAELGRLRDTIDHKNRIADKALADYAAELARLRAELSAVQVQHLHEIDELAAQAKIMNGLRAEVDAANKHCDILKESNSRACAEVERLTSNATAWTAVRAQDFKDYEEALARAERAEAQLATDRKDSDLLDWLIREDIVKFLDRDAIDRAMKETNP